jgi:hypothetical protein
VLRRLVETTTQSGHSSGLRRCLLIAAKQTSSGDGRRAVNIPGTAGIVEAKAALMAQAVQHQWNIVTAAPEKEGRWPSAGDLGKRLQQRG